MCHSMKLYERVHENRLRNTVVISKEQFGFMKGKSTTGAIFVLRQLQERYRDRMMFFDLEKKHTTESQGKNRIGVRGTRGYQRSTSDW